MPKIKEIITATKPIEIDTLEPIIRRLNKSLPNLSVPKIKNFFFKYFFSISFLPIPSAKSL